MGLHLKDEVIFKEREETYLKMKEKEKACEDFKEAKKLGSEEVDKLIKKNCKDG